MAPPSNRYASLEHNGIVCIGMSKERVRLTLSAGPALPDPHVFSHYEGDKLNEVVRAPTSGLGGHD
jgi:hypothetical protein